MVPLELLAVAATAVGPLTVPELVMVMGPFFVAEEMPIDRSLVTYASGSAK
jgi:hypothetical protein